MTPPAAAGPLVILDSQDVRGRFYVNYSQSRTIMRVAQTAWQPHVVCVCVFGYLFACVLLCGK